MDYTNSSIFFKIKKFYRYLNLYGLARTLAKVKGQYHMKRHFDILPDCPNSSSISNPLVAIVGCGNFSYSNIAFYLTRIIRPDKIICMDKCIDKSASLFSDYRLHSYTDSIDVIASNPSVKIVYIASNHASHASYAARCLDSGKHVHIEKPHVVTYEDLELLLSAIARNPGLKVFLGFNRPKSRLFKLLTSYLSLESGPLMVNWFIAGHEIPDNHWYFMEDEGGRILGNLCHWTDLTLHLVGLNEAFPCKIVPATPSDSKSDFIVSLNFADRSCATFTFSAKGHSFEGVREVLNIHKGNLTGSLTNFQTLSVDIGERKLLKRLSVRDHGHKVNILNSFKSVLGGFDGESVEYIRATALLFLGIRKSVESGESLVVDV